MADDQRNREVPSDTLTDRVRRRLEEQGNSPGTARALLEQPPWSSRPDPAYLAAARRRLNDFLLAPAAAPPPAPQLTSTAAGETASALQRLLEGVERDQERQDRQDAISYRFLVE